MHITHPPDSFKLSKIPHPISGKLVLLLDVGLGNKLESPRSRLPLCSIVSRFFLGFVRSFRFRFHCLHARYSIHAFLRVRQKQKGGFQLGIALLLSNSNENTGAYVNFRKGLNLFYACFEYVHAEPVFLFLYASVTSIAYKPIYTTPRNKYKFSHVLQLSNQKELRVLYRESGH